MAQQQETPIHWDQHASKWNLTLIFGLVVAVLGIVTANPLLTPLGLLMSAYSWFTTPRQYLLYRDRMVVVYGMPRTRVIPFGDISHVEILALPFGERLRLRMVSGSRMMLMMRDPGAFRDHLEDALAAYHGEHSGGFRAERYGTAVLDAADNPAPGDTESAADSAPAGGDAPAGDAAPGGETRAGGGYEPSPTSGSYTEGADRPPPDYSGEGNPAYGADVDLDTGRPGEREERDRPPSPY